MKSTHSILCCGSLCLVSLLAFFLRRWQLAAGQAAGLLLPLFALILLAALLVLARFRPKDPQFQSGGGLGYLLGGILLAVSAALDLQEPQTVAFFAALLGILAGGITVFQGVQRCKGRTPNLLLGCVIVLWLVLRIIGNFKVWSTNPAVLDYCYPLFALLCSMAGCFHMAGCLAGLGKGRLTLFWCAAAVFFCGIALADCTPVSGLVYAGLLLLSLQNVWVLLCAKK